LPPASALFSAGWALRKKSSSHESSHFNPNWHRFKEVLYHPEQSAGPLSCDGVTQRDRGIEGAALARRSTGWSFTRDSALAITRSLCG
jgi:hypothetical protein